MHPSQLPSSGRPDAGGANNATPDGTGSWRGTPISRDSSSFPNEQPARGGERSRQKAQAHRGREPGGGRGRLPAKAAIPLRERGAVKGLRGEFPAHSPGPETKVSFNVVREIRPVHHELPRYDNHLDRRQTPQNTSSRIRDEIPIPHCPSRRVQAQLCRIHQRPLERVR